MKELLDGLIDLSRQIGRDDRRLAILGEGNTSVDLGDGTFLVKSSGCRLSDLDETGVSRIRADAVLSALDREELDDSAVQAALQAALADGSMRQPSVETFMHAVCLTEGQARWVGHCHAESVMSILCSKHGGEPFLHHIFPDAIVVCGRHVAVVPYLDPGLVLAREVRRALRGFRAARGAPPKVLLLENHGPVALGGSAAEILNILLMLDKWARVLAGTLALGGPRFLPETSSDRIDRRPDEHYRRARIAAAP